MELRQLKYFVTIAETLSFSKAATKLFISQSTLSKQIAGLEQDLDTVLFERNRQKVELTPSGRVLYLKARELVDNADSIPILLANFSESSRQERRQVNIGMTDVLLTIPLYAQAFLHTREALQERYPEVDVHLTSTRMSKVRKDLNSGLLDLGIVATDDLQNKGLNDLANYRIFQEFPVYLVTAKNSGLGEYPTKEQLREFLCGKDICMHTPRARVHMQAYQICAELDARPNSISTMENPRLFVRVACGDCVTFSWDGVVEERLSDCLSFSALPVPAAKVYAMFCWEATDGYVQTFANTFRAYVAGARAEQWQPVSGKIE